MKSRIVFRTAAALCVAGLAIAPSAATAAPVAAAAGTLTDTGHRPGESGFGVDLPAEAFMTTTDGTTVKHPCAGRKLVYHSHNDALYGTRVNGQDLAVMAVDGQQVVSQDSLCFRLPPDADGQGRELSRFVIPDDDSLSFLGKPGDAVWIAPQAVDWNDHWRPLWSGLGAFDPQHEASEKSVPTDFVDGTMYFDMTDYSGPGDMQIFFGSPSSGNVERVFSNKDKDLQSIGYEVGAHGHFNWTFTKPGIYKVTWTGRAKHTDGTEETTEPITQYWLVGSDSQVGLKDGTTVGLNKITSPVDANGSTGPTGSAEPTEPTEPSGPTKPTTPSQPSTEPTQPTQPPTDPAAAQRCYAAAALANHPEHIIESGHMDMALQSEGEGGVAARLHDGADASAPAQRESGTFAFAVPDSARTAIKEKFRAQLPGAPDKLWILPQSQQPGLPWLGFSTTDLAPGTLGESDKVDVTMSNVTGPGRIIAWHDNLSGVKVNLDSQPGDNEQPSGLKYGMSAHDHLAFGFTEPGFYSATFTFTGKTASGAAINEGLHVPFLVGDDAVNTAKEYVETGYAELGEATGNCAGDRPGTTEPTETTDPTPGKSTAGKTTTSEKLDPNKLAAGIRGIGVEIGKLDKAVDNLLTVIRPNHRKGSANSAKNGKGSTATPTKVGGTGTVSGAVAKVGAPAQAASSGSGSGAVAGASKTAANDAVMGAPASAGVVSSGTAGGASVSGDQAQPLSGGGEAGAETAAEASPQAAAEGGQGPIQSSLAGAGGAGAAQKAAAEPGIRSAASSLTAGGFWAGLAFGIGMMALCGGIIFFLSAKRALEDLKAEEARL